MSYAGSGMGRVGGFGQVAIEREVPYRDDRTGVEGVAVASTDAGCGDPYAVQVMLWWLGFYEGPIHGQLDDATRAALAAYALSRGINYNPATTPSGAVCAALIADHEAYWAQQQLAPTGARGGGGQAGQCPEGTVGLPPYCVSMPGTAPPPVPGGACPPGTVGIPPNCFGVPAGLPTIPPQQLPPGPPPVKEPPPPPAERTTDGWWDKLSTGEKIAIGGGALLVGWVLIRAVKPKRMTPNRRRATQNKVRSRS